ncbi:MAG: hypothetical protein V3T88_07195 [Nitrosomonadaceae bacterium]
MPQHTPAERAKGDNLRADQDPELHATLVSYFEEYEQQTRDGRMLNERDRDYTDHKQLTDDELSALRSRGQPPIQTNVIRKKINFLRGYERQIRTDPKAFPRTPNHEDDANAITDSLRYIADNASFDVSRSSFWDNYLVEGTGAVEVIVSRNKKREVETPHIQWDRLFWDFHSRKLDFSDALFTGIIIWDDADNIKRNFPGSSDVIDATMSSSVDDTFEDKPTTWVDSKRKRVRIAQIYFQFKGLWHLAFYTKTGFLLDPILSPWQDEDGFPENGMIMQSAYIDREGNRFGEPRFMIETQDSINKRESKMLHLVSQRQTFGNKRAFPDGVGAQKRELAKPDGHVELSGNAEFGRDFGILPTGDMAQGQFQLLQEAKQAALANGTASFQGSPGAENQSGRAIIAQQNGQQIEINPLADGKRQWEMRVYRAWWNRVRQFWTEERWIRVTDDQNNAKFVGLNRKIPVREIVEKEMGGIPPEFEGDERLEMASDQIENQVSEIDVDIIIEDSPDIVTIQQEEFRNLIDLANVGITFDQDVYIKASNLRNKQELLRDIEGKDEAAQQQIAQQAQAQQATDQAFQQLQVEAVSAEVEKDGADSMLKQAQAAKTQQEAIQTEIENEQLQRGVKL